MQGLCMSHVPMSLSETEQIKGHQMQRHGGKAAQCNLLVSHLLLIFCSPWSFCVSLLLPSNLANWKYTCEHNSTFYFLNVLPFSFRVS